MTKTIDTALYIDTLLSLLNEGNHDVPLPIKGISMRPFLREGDTVFLNKLQKSLKKGDIVLFRRLDGSYVLHRIAGVCADGSFMLLGDCQTRLEPIDFNCILAIATSARRKGKLITESSPVWIFYRTLWLDLYRLRRYFAIFKKTP